MHAVDTNVLVRLIVRADPEQVDRAEAFVAQGAWVSLLVLAEAVWVLDSVYGLNRERIGTVVRMLIERDRLTLQEEDVVRTAHSMRAVSTSLRQPGSAFTVATPRHRRVESTIGRAVVAAGQRSHTARRPGCRSSVLGHPGGWCSTAD